MCDSTKHNGLITIYLWDFQHIQKHYLDSIEVDFECLSAPSPCLCDPNSSVDNGIVDIVDNVDIVLAFFDWHGSSVPVGGTGLLKPVRDTGDVKSGIAAIGFKSSGEDKIIGRSIIDMERRNLNEPTPEIRKRFSVFLIEKDNDAPQIIGGAVLDDVMSQNELTTTIIRAPETQV